eukprot:TRINITY_DN17846_c0_g1_i2.p1 TRINITY_DN17846_c0_g1~~TRINITY_DN17846_c0_g1_i2.p1  ORF type:complete len:351 (-),score=66.06 TRINITY_DN17846_c0_g1_i2:97-1026(-)
MLRSLVGSEMCIRDSGMEPGVQPTRRRRRRGPGSTEPSSNEPNAEPRFGDAGNVRDPHQESPARAEMDATPPRIPTDPSQSPERGGVAADDPAEQKAPELPTSEEDEEEAQDDEGVVEKQVLLAVKRNEAARKSVRDNTTPIPATFLHVHMIGEVERGTGFGVGSFVKWTVVTGDRWELVRGVDGGRSFQDATIESQDGYQGSIWEHPIDIYYAVSQHDRRGGWPKLLVQVFTCDFYGREELAGYGMCQIPLVPGTHELEIPTWIPTGAPNDVQTEVLGCPVQLMDDYAVLSGEPVSYTHLTLPTKRIV